MASLNKVMVIGNVGSDPEMRFTPSGSPVTSFRVATNRVYTTADGERRQETEWFTVVAWNRLAEQCNQFLNKGRLIYAEGRLHTRNWEGQDGQKRSQIEIIANRVVFLDRQVSAPLPEEKIPEEKIPEEKIPEEKIPEEKVEGADVGELEPEDVEF